MSGKKMSGSTAGIWRILAIPLTVVVLIIIIIQNEPKREGISRAAAYKAAALVLADMDTIREDPGEPSRFSVADQRQWYVKYMDFLYSRGILTEEEAPAGTSFAEGMLTWKEAKKLTDSVLDYLALLPETDDALPDGEQKRSAGVTASLRQQINGMFPVAELGKSNPIPAERWWYVYDGLCGASAEGERIREEIVQIYATPDNSDELPPWTADTDLGPAGFEGLSLSGYIDREIRALMKDGEMIRIVGKTSDTVTYHNIWITEVSDSGIKGYAGESVRTFTLEGNVDLPEDMINHLADIRLREGYVSGIVMKRDTVTAKVLAVKDDGIELEGYGFLPLDTNFCVYKTYGEWERMELSDILVGYDTQEFIVADRKICAALIVRTFDAQTIRVLLTDTDFSERFHQTVSLRFLSDGVMRQGEKETVFHKGETMTFESGDGSLDAGRILFIPADGTGGICVESVMRSQGAPVYPGRLEILQEDDGLVLINELYLEDYVKRVLPSEMPLSYEPEALKAQAVCARTYAFRQIRANTYREYGAHVDDSTAFQVYNNGKAGAPADAAVNSTYGQFLTYGDDVAETYYFSTSCGHTADVTVWRADPEAVPYLSAKAVRAGGGKLDLTTNAAFAEFIKSPGDGYESDCALYRWNTRLTSDQLAEKIDDIGTITKVAVSERGAGGIGKKLVVVGTGGERTFEGEGRIRSVLGNTELVFNKNDGKTMTGLSSLPSAFISVERSEPDENGVTTFFIYGGGYGHGVGMSQNGAEKMAEKGLTYRDILSFFYEGTELSQFY